ncbi:MAG: GDSL-type esterase/lipase family protein [Planctomycetota bacterium]
MLAVLGVAACAVLGACFALETYRPRFEPDEPRASALSAAPACLEGEHQLQADTRIDFNGERFASQRFRGAVRFDEPGLAELTLHQADERRARFYVVLLSADDCLPTSIWHATDVDFTRSAHSAGYRFPLGEWVDLEVVVSGASISVRVDGIEVDREWGWEELVGLTALNGLRGVCRLRDVTVEPLPWPADAQRPWTLWLLVGATMTGTLVLWGLGAAIIALGSAQQDCPSRLASEALPFWPLSLYLAWLLAHPGPAHLAGLLIAGVATLVFKGASIIRWGRGLGFLAQIGASASSGVLFVAFGLLIAPRLMPDPVTQANTIAYFEWHGKRLPRDLLWYLHPLCRRWNDYLANRSFRGRSVRLWEEGARPRIVCLGTSSTWGHGFAPAERAEYPAQLEDLLAERSGAAQAEVINAAIPGSGGSRLLLFFRDQLLLYQPDIVTVSLRFNDSALLAQADESAYFQRISAPDFERPIWHHLRERFKLWLGKRRYLERRTDGRFELVPGEEWPEARQCIKSFARLLADFSQVCRKNSIRLLFVVEPCRERRILLDELGAIMREKGLELGVPVLDLDSDFAGGLAGTLFLPGDPVHPSREGHALIARRLADKLRELEWVE